MWPLSQDTLVAVEQTFSAETVATPDDLFDVLSDLSTYPQWLDVVAEATPVGGDGDEGSTKPAWLVTLKARVGPFARSKRLRMVRTSIDPDTRTVVFDRSELDERSHSAWQLRAIVEPCDAKGMQSASNLRLTYSGAMWSGPLSGILDSAAERATTSLQQFVAER